MIKLKASLTVEASFIFIICFSVLLMVFLVMFELYHENVDYYLSRMKEVDIDAVSRFRFVSVLKRIA